MDRIRRFQRTLITALTGINSFVFSVTNDQGVGRSFLFAAGAMLIALLLIFAFIAIKKMSVSRRFSGK